MSGETTGHLAAEVEHQRMQALYDRHVDCENCGRKIKEYISAYCIYCGHKNEKFTGWVFELLNGESLHQTQREECEREHPQAANIFAQGRLSNKIRYYCMLCGTCINQGELN